MSAVRGWRIACALAMTVLAAPSLQAQDTVKVAGRDVALAGTAGSLLLPSAIAGTSGSALDQVDEITRKVEALLAARRMKAGDLMRHTIFLKAGAQEPVQIFTRLIGNLRKLGPELTNNPTAGTIVLVPSFPDPATEIMVELVAAHAPKSMTRVPIMLGPRMSVESIGNDEFVASFGLEGLDFYGVGGLPNGTLDEELDSLVRVLGAVMGHAGMSIANVVSYNFYVTQGTDPVLATTRLHQLMRERAPQLDERPSTGTVVVIDGATIPNLRVQLTVIASRNKPESLSRVPFGEVPAAGVAQSVTAGGTVFVSGLGGVDYEKQGAIGATATAQAAVAARNVHTALRNAGGRKLSNVARFDVYVKHGEDSAAALAAFYESARKLDASFDPARVAAVVTMVRGFPRQSTRFLVSAIASAK